MAGPFGFEAEKYEVSQACGERVLLPSVRKASREELVIADGFSCREQIRQNTDRYALHLADVMSMAIKNDLPKKGKPESPVTKRLEAEAALGKLKAGATAAVLLGGAALGLLMMFGVRRQSPKRKVIEMPAR